MTIRSSSGPRGDSIYSNGGKKGAFLHSTALVSQVSAGVDWRLERSRRKEKCQAGLC